MNKNPIKDRINIIDRLMYVNPLESKYWEPKNFLDIKYPWDERYLNEFGQPFSPFKFAQNCGAIFGVSLGTELNKKTFDQIDFLTFIADKHIDNNEYAHVVNNFEYSNFFCVFESGWHGAFMNAYTAYGFLFLYRATGNLVMAEKAKILLSSVINDSALGLSGLDQRGDFWFYEYVFKTDPLSAECLASFGLKSLEDGFIRAKVFNGHVHTLLVFLQYQAITSDSTYDEIIKLALKTVEKRFPFHIQLGAFTYLDDFDLLDDYSQKRPVHQIDGLMELFPEKSILKDISNNFSRVHVSVDAAAAHEEWFSTKEYFKRKEIFLEVKRSFSKSAIVRID